MRALVQRVSAARVAIGTTIQGEIGPGLLVFLGIGRNDTHAEVRWLADKTAGLRIFPDSFGKMGVGPKGAGAEFLVVSQFTLYGSVKRGLRPDFCRAALPDAARALYKAYCDLLASRGFHVETGEFGAHMTVELTNDGPVTIYIDTDEVMADG